MENGNGGYSIPMVKDRFNNSILSMFGMISLNLKCISNFGFYGGRQTTFKINGYFKSNKGKS